MDGYQQQLDEWREQAAVSVAGGIADYGRLPAYHEAVRDTPSTPWPDEKFFEMTLANGLLFEPGTGWSYSNVGYLILRRVINAQAGVLRPRIR